MESLFGRYKNALVLMLVLLAQVVLLAMQVRRPAPNMPDGHNVRLWRYMVSGVITPPERLAHNIGKGVRDIWSNYIYLRNLREQNEGLKRENDRLRLEQAGLAEDALQGQRLRELLDFRGRYIDKTVAAQVIGTSGTDQARDITIDKGSKDGLDVQMPVVTPDGIVGKIKNVFPHSAQVLLISDQTSGTGVLLANTRVRGVMKGNASGQPQMINISPDERIQPGEPVITSGGDQVYPPGMPVGVVEKVVPDPDSSYVNVVVKPNANLGSLEEVLVVVQFSDKMPFAQAKDLSASEAVALAAKQRAADVLSEKLPSLRDPNAPETAQSLTPDAEKEAAASAASGSEADPARPVRPPQALHPDRYTPGQAPAAENLVPGAAPPGIHRTAPATTAAATPGPKSNTPSSAPAPSGSDTALVSRFPAKPVTAVPKPATNATATPTNPAAPTTHTAASGSATPSGSGAATVPSAPGPGLQRPVRTAASADTPSGTASTVAPVRRTPTPPESDSGGILTPAGMGAVGTTPRPKPTTPKTQTPPATQTNPAPTGNNSPPASTPPGGM